MSRRRSTYQRRTPSPRVLVGLGLGWLGYSYALSYFLLSAFAS